MAVLLLLLIVPQLGHVENADPCIRVTKTNKKCSRIYPFLFSIRTGTTAYLA